jgi:phosphatidylethanolamine/phosphatidyl-N-methylethanolamine N-methyltransferase
VLVEFNPTFCRMLRTKFPAATVVQGNAYSLRRALGDALSEPAAAVVSGLPLMTKPMITRLRLITDAFSVMAQGSPFVQFTYAVVPPIPTDFSGVSAEASELVWMNLPPARVWVYRHR